MKWHHMRGGLIPVHEFSPCVRVEVLTILPRDSACFPTERGLSTDGTGAAVSGEFTSYFSTEEILMFGRIALLTAPLPEPASIPTWWPHFLPMGGTPYSVEGEEEIDDDDEDDDDDDDDFGDDDDDDFDDDDDDAFDEDDDLDDDEDDLDDLDDLDEFDDDDDLDDDLDDDDDDDDDEDDDEEDDIIDD